MSKEDRPISSMRLGLEMSKCNDPPTERLMIASEEVIMDFHQKMTDTNWTQADINNSYIH